MPRFMPIHLWPPESSVVSAAYAKKSPGNGHQEIDNNANALGHVALPYFIGEAVDSVSNRHSNRIVNTPGHIALGLCE